MNPKLVLGLKIVAAVITALGLGFGAGKVTSSALSESACVKQTPCKCECKVILPPFNVTKGRFEK